MNKIGTNFEAGKILTKTTSFHTMRLLLTAAALAISLSLNAQLRFETKSVIRPINIKLSKSQTDKMNNTGSEKDFVEYKNGGAQETLGEEYFLSIANPNKIPIIFATGTADFMTVETAEASTVWQSRTVDLWQNIIIKTGKKQFSYSIKTNHCYSFVWKRGENAWDLKKVKCDSYADEKKEK